MQQVRPKTIWGGTRALFHHASKLAWLDFVLLIGLVGLVFELIAVEREWTGSQRETVEIDLSPWALPQYTLFSLSRGLIAYVLSFAFTLVYGYWAAADRRAERVLIPLLDILQSIPVLGFMPALVLALVVVFPASNVGLELHAARTLRTSLRHIRPLGQIRRLVQLRRGDAQPGNSGG